MLSSVLLSVALGAVSVFSVPTISAKGAKLFTSDGNQFFIKGKIFSTVLCHPCNANSYSAGKALPTSLLMTIHWPTQASALSMRPS